MPGAAVGPGLLCFLARVPTSFAVIATAMIEFTIASHVHCRCRSRGNETDRDILLFRGAGRGLYRSADKVIDSEQQHQDHRDVEHERARSKLRIRCIVPIRSIVPIFAHYAALPPITRENERPIWSRAELGQPLNPTAIVGTDPPATVEANVCFGSKTDIRFARYAVSLTARGASRRFRCLRCGMKAAPLAVLPPV